jgi:hypothetical protein
MHLPSPIIQLPLSGDEGSEHWLYLVVARQTGVRYLQQYGGLRCRQAEQEGFLVLVSAPSELNALRTLFSGELGGVGILTGLQRDRLLAKHTSYLREVLHLIEYPSNYSEEARHIALDEARLSELDEAWVPVSTPDGPGYLAWANSD